MTPILLQKEQKQKHRGHDPNVSVPVDMIHTIVAPIIVVTTLIKILLIPSYKSTDFDVHRNWLAITHHLPINEWYYDSVNGTTVHTLDYPPSFAFFEYFLSNNYITTRYLLMGNDNDSDSNGSKALLNDTCLALLGDHENDIVGDDCVTFQRCTVIIFDIIFLIGSYMICRSFLFEQNRDNDIGATVGNGDGDDDEGNGNGDGNGGQKDGSAAKVCIVEGDGNRRFTVAFVLLITNSGLILLDHVHFQYNGMLLGILLASLAMLLQSIKVQQQQQQQQQQQYEQHQPIKKGGSIRRPDGPTNTTRMKKFDLLGAILFALLLTFKHMYLTLSPFYFFYLLRRFCFSVSEPTIKTNEGVKVSGSGSNSSSSGSDLCVKEQFSFKSFIILGCTVLVVLVGPFVPFLRYGAKEQMLQIISRLFPWQRGLCHDYWAGNVWALYLGLEKAMRFLFWLIGKVQSSNKIAGLSILASIVSTTERMIAILRPPFPTITPSTAAICLFIGLVPAMYCSWKIGSSATTTTTSTHNDNKNNNSNNFNNRIRQEGLLYTIVFSSLSSFMLAYHVHEKAIMTAIIPMTVLAVTSKENARLFLRLSSVGHFGLMPLLYRSNELLMKVCLHGSYFLWSLYLLEYVHGAHSKDMKNSTKDKDCSSPNLLTIWDKAGLGIMGILVVYVEVIHPLELFPQISKLEFLPLMMTSLWCAIILVGCWIHCGTIMLRLAQS